jgi:hypothetical protein
MKNKSKIKEVLLQADIEDLRVIAELTKKARIKLEEKSLDGKKLKKIIDKATEFKKRNSGRKFKSDIVVSILGKEHVFVMNLIVHNICFQSDVYDNGFGLELEYTLDANKKSFLDLELGFGLETMLDNAVYDDYHFYKILKKEVPEFAKIAKEFDAINAKIYALEDVESEFVMKKIG